MVARPGSNAIVHTRRGFRFTIGQGMMVIALLAVAMAMMPMPAAVALAVLTARLLVFGRNQSRNRTRAFSSVGCPLCLLGFLVGAMTGMIWPNTSTDCGLVVIPFALGFGLAGSVIAAVAGLAVSLALPRRPPSSHDRSESNNEQSTRIDCNDTQAELERVEQLLRHARRHDDDVVTAKLRDYKERLENDLQQ